MVDRDFTAEEAGFGERGEKRRDVTLNRAGRIGEATPDFGNDVIDRPRAVRKLPDKRAGGVGRNRRGVVRVDQKSPAVGAAFADGQRVGNWYVGDLVSGQRNQPAPAPTGTAAGLSMEPRRVDVWTLLNVHTTGSL